MIVTVSGSAALTSALSAAHPNDTILLASGVYDDVQISNLAAGGVTVASADPGAPAVINNLQVSDTSGLSFRGIEINVAPGQNGYGVSVNNSQDIHFDAMQIHGTANGAPTDDRSGMSLKNSSNVSVSNSEFHDLKSGVNAGLSNGVEVAGNTFHDIRIDGVQNAGSSNVAISDNVFTNFRHIAGDHSDAVQFSTNSRSVSAENITVTGNLIVEGDGAPMQGVFMRDEVGTQPYVNVKISDNVILGGNWNGIAVDHGQGVVITGNTLVAQLRPPGALATQSRLIVNNSDDVTATGNTSSVFFHSNVTHFTDTGNTASDPLADTAPATVHEWLAAHNLSDRGQPLAGGDNPVTGADNPVTGGGNPATGVDSPATGVDNHVADAGNNVLVGGAKSDHLHGGEGDDKISGGGAFDDINGNQGNDTASGGLGDDWVVGGKDNDRLSGDAGQDIVWGNLGADTQDGGDAADQVRGGQGNDVVMGGAGNDFVSGDRGDDTVTGGTGADLFHGSQDAGLDRITDFHVGEGDRVMLDPGTKYSVSQVGADTVIDMGAGHEMILADVQLSTLHTGWIFTG